MSAFHAGEEWVQERAGVRNMARKVGNGIHAAVPPAAREFLLRQPFVVVGSTERDGRVWASLLTGQPGFIRVVDDRTVGIDAVPAPDGPLARTLNTLSAGEQTPVGLLAIEPATRRRMRLNGGMELPPGGLRVHAVQVYANCPKYIQKREAEPEAGASPAPELLRAKTLDASQQEWVAHADTFFVASASDAGDADASHRGGLPGFVHVLDARTLVWPDYSGNAMFNTLGNIAVNPHVGLLLPDFARGRTLQLTGTARILWDPADSAPFAGAERAVAFTVEEVIQTDNAFPLRLHLTEHSPFNPTDTDKGD